jgi:hypothetical protein
MKIKPVNPVVKTLAYNPKHGGQHTPYEFKNKTNQAVKLQLSQEALDYLNERNKNDQS